MNKEEKLKDNSKLLKIVIIILFIAFFVLGISQCVNDAVKTTYAENEVTENVEVNNKFIDKKVNKAINNVVGTAVPNDALVENIYINAHLTAKEVYDLCNALTYYPFGDIILYPIFIDQTTNKQVCISKDTSNTNIVSYLLFQVGYNSEGSLDIVRACYNSLQNRYYYEEQLPSDYVININEVNMISMVGPIFATNYVNQNNQLIELVSITPFDYGGSGGGITPNERSENPLFTIPSGYEKVTDIVLDINPSQTTYNVARVVVCGKLDFNTENNDYYYDLFYGFACGGVKKEYEVDKATRLTNGINDLFLNDRFLIQINISEQNSITFNLSYLQENTTKINLNEEMQCNSSYASNNLFNSKGLNSMLLTRNFIKNYYNDIGFENGRVYGYEQGLNDGNVEGYNQGYQEGYDTGYLEGDTAGYNRGFIDGEDDGYDLGYHEGETAGYNEGYNVGNQTGLENGYNNGFNDGQKDTLANNGFRNIVNSIFNAPYNIFNGFLNFEIFGINLFNLLAFAFTTILIIFIIGVLIKR